MRPWHEDERLWAALEPVLLSDSAIAAAPGEARLAADLLGVPPGAALLDLACGPGRHTVELARIGYEVTGVDRTERYIDRARERAVAAGVSPELVRASMLEFRREHAFDGAVCLFTSFGYYDDYADNQRVLENIHASLRPGARVLIDLAGKEWLAQNWRPRDWQQYAPDRFWLQEREVLPGWSSVRVHWWFLGDVEPGEFTFEHPIWSGAELDSMLRAAGFASVSLYGGLDGRPYDGRAERLLALGTR